MKKHVDTQLDKKQGEYVADERAFRLLEALSGVDEELIERCEQSKKVVQMSAFRKNITKYGRACAAVVCLLVVGTLTWGGYRVGVDNAATGVAESAREGAVYDYTNETDMLVSSPEPYIQTADVTDKVMAESTDRAENAGSIGGGEAADNGKAEGMVSGATGNLESAVTNGAEYNAVPNSGEREGAVSEADSDKMVSPVTKAREITLEEAYKIEGLGDYVPAVLPAGYVLESAYYYDQETPQKLTVCWSRGMDSIFWHISQEDAEALNIVDVDRTETYNEYLYEIPHAETVPEEHREIFSNPVCKFEDFSLEFVEKRMISRSGDAGDTDTPRGIFSVLYPDDVVVKFNGRGTAEEVWAMFSSIKRD